MKRASLISVKGFIVGEYHYYIYHIYTNLKMTVNLIFLNNKYNSWKELILYVFIISKFNIDGYKMVVRFIYILFVIN